jgi:hypothetical protein
MSKIARQLHDLSLISGRRRQPGKRKELTALAAYAKLLRAYM